MTSSTSESLPPQTSGEETSGKDSMPQRPKIIEAWGYRGTALARIVFKKAREAPIVGKAVGYVEDTVSPWMEPAIAHAEKDGLYLLSLVDTKIHIVSDLAMAYVPFAAKFVPHLQGILSGQPIDTALMVLDRVRTRGVIGSTADAWVDYEPIVKSESEKIYSLVVRVPGAHIVVSILHDIGSPLMSIASDWLVMRTEFKDKHEISLQREGGSPQPSDSPLTPRKAPNRDDSRALDFNALADESDSEAQNSRDFSYADAVKSKGAAQEGEGDFSYADAVKSKGAAQEGEGDFSYADAVKSKGAAQEGEGDFSYADAVKSKGAAQEGEGETDEVPVEEGESASSDGNKGKFPELTVVHGQAEERDEVSDLFDTWGMGVKAIGPESLKSIRSLSLK